MMEKKCLNCKHWEELYSDAYETDEERVGECNWGVGRSIPYSWRYSTSEVTGVCAADGSDCPTFEPIT
jgi:hypothetical protein